MWMPTIQLLNLYLPQMCQNGQGVSCTWKLFYTFHVKFLVLSLDLIFRNLWSIKSNQSIPFNIFPSKSSFCNSSFSISQFQFQNWYVFLKLAPLWVYNHCKEDKFWWKNIPSATDLAKQTRILLHTNS